MLDRLRLLLFSFRRRLVLVALFAALFVLVAAGNRGDENVSGEGIQIRTRTHVVTAAGTVPLDPGRTIFLSVSKLNASGRSGYSPETGYRWDDAADTVWLPGAGTYVVASFYAE